MGLSPMIRTFRMHLWSWKRDSVSIRPDFQLIGVFIL